MSRLDTPNSNKNMIGREGYQFSHKNKQSIYIINKKSWWIELQCQRLMQQNGMSFVTSYLRWAQMNSCENRIRINVGGRRGIEEKNFKKWLFIIMISFIKEILCWWLCLFQITERPLGPKELYVCGRETIGISEKSINTGKIWKTVENDESLFLNLLRYNMGMPLPTDSNLDFCPMAEGWILHQQPLCQLHSGIKYKKWQNKNHILSICYYYYYYY